MQSVVRLYLGIIVATAFPCAALLPAQAVLAESGGESNDEGLGASVGFAGDVDGDGFDDVIVGAPQFKLTATKRPGRALVISGKTGATLHTLLGTADFDDFGRAAAGAGDVDADGSADVIVGAPRADLLGTDAGTATVFSGATGAALFTLSGDSAFDGFGSAVACAGDVDGDGHDDLIIGAPNDDPHGFSSGSARVVSGVNGATLFLITGDSAYDLCGASVAGAGDVNEDGHADLLVGMPGDSFAGIPGGTARVVSGATGLTLFAWHGAAAEDDFGAAVAGVGDMNGDGVPDFAVGARLDDHGALNSGAVYLFSGASGLLLREHHGSAVGDLFGSAVFGAGDMNGDGRPELVVGAPYDHCNGSNCGAASVFSGATGGLLYAYHGAAGEFLGSSVGGRGDADGDGHDDIIVGLPFADTIYGTGAGQARVYSATVWLNLGLAASGGPGAQGSALFSATGDLQPQQPFSLSLSGAASLAPSMLVVGLSVINAPFKGATMVPRPDFVSVAIPTDAAGGLTLAGFWPAGVPADLTLTMQWWSLDPGADAGMSSSNALQAITP